MGEKRKDICPFSGDAEVSCGNWCELYLPGGYCSCGLVTGFEMIIQELRLNRDQLAATTAAMRESGGSRG